MLDKRTIEGQLVSRRTFIIGAGKLGLLFLLAGRMFYMQFIKKNEYKTLSDQNRIKMIVIAPSRGQIYDKARRVIAKNNTCFKLLLDKNINSSFEEEVKTIIEVLELDSDQIKEITNRVKKAGRRIPALIIDCLDWQQVSVIEERKEVLKSLFVDIGNIRFYKYADDTVHLLGYMGKTDKSTKIDDLAFTDENFRVGKSGIEKFYEDTLRGKFGFKQVEVNAHGNYVRKLSENQPLRGDELHLNIDAELQKKITPYLNNKGCSAIVMDCLDGSILSCCSTPSYDPNNFNFLSSKYWAHLIQNPHKPLINKTIHSLYPPGSIFKLITVLAALESGIVPSHMINCNGGPVLGGNSFRCVKTTGHGSLNMHDAIMYSCNIYMFEIAKLIGPEKIISMAQKFGFGSKTGIDLPSELAGFVPTLDWKKKEFGNKWSLGDTFNLSIGQGFLLCTPMQLSRFITAIATNGKLYTPKIVKSKADYIQLALNNDHINFLKEAMHSTVNMLGGTGYSAKLSHNEIDLAGKTGTAQVVAKKNTNDDLSRSDIAWTRRNHAIFTGYAPSENPRYSVTVYYDHGGGGGKAAAPIARTIIEKILETYL
jgi:penicillin-binding protein 2